MRPYILSVSSGVWGGVVVEEVEVEFGEIEGIREEAVVVRVRVVVWARPERERVVEEKEEGGACSDGIVCSCLDEDLIESKESEDDDGRVNTVEAYLFT